MSRLAPAVQKVKDVFSPVHKSSDVPTAGQEDDTSQLPDTQGTHTAAGAVPVSSCGAQEVAKLQEALAARESQLEAQAHQMADLDATLRSLQVPFQNWLPWYFSLFPSGHHLSLELHLH
jgi:hypothetical protein